MKKKLLIALAAFTILSACAKPSVQLSRQEWLEIKTKTYTNVTKDQALNAAEKLLSLADKGFEFSHSDVEVMGILKNQIFTFFGIREGRLEWKIKVIEQNAEGVTLLVDAQRIAALAGQSSIGQPNLYKLFWWRMDYLLGKSDNWVSCKTAVEDFGMKTNDILDENSVGLLCRTENRTDASPD